MSWLVQLWSDAFGKAVVTLFSGGIIWVLASIWRFGRRWFGGAKKLNERHPQPLPGPGQNPLPTLDREPAPSGVQNVLGEGELADHEINVLQSVADGLNHYPEEIGRKAKLDKVALEWAIGEVLGRGLIEEGTAASGLGSFRLSQAGRAWLIAHRGA